MRKRPPDVPRLYGVYDDVSLYEPPPDYPINEEDPELSALFKLLRILIICIYVYTSTILFNHINCITKIFKPKYISYNKNLENLRG